MSPPPLWTPRSLARGGKIARPPCPVRPECVPPWRSQRGDGRKAEQGSAIGTVADGVSGCAREHGCKPDRRSERSLPHDDAGPDSAGRDRDAACGLSHGASRARCGCCDGAGARSACGQDGGAPFQGHGSGHSPCGTCIALNGLTSAPYRASAPHLGDCKPSLGRQRFVATPSICLL